MPDNKLMPLPNSSEANDSNSQPLPSSLRHEFETKFGQNLSDVRVYENHQATHLNAAAYSQGNDVFFAPGKYQPFTESGNDLIGHELTHVVQQRGQQTTDVPQGMVKVGDGNQSDTQ